MNSSHTCGEPTHIHYISGDAPDADRAAFNNGSEDFRRGYTRGYHSATTIMLASLQESRSEFQRTFQTIAEQHAAKWRAEVPRLIRIAFWWGIGMGAAASSAFIYLHYHP